MFASRASQQSSRSRPGIAGILPVLLALPLLAGGGVLVGSGLGLELPLVEVMITAAWARWLFLATGAYLLVDGGGMLARLVRGEPDQPQSAEEKRLFERRALLRSRARMAAWIALLGLLTLALPLQAFQILRGAGVFMLLLGLLLLVLGVLSVTGMLIGSRSLDLSAAQWTIPSRTLEKLEAGAGLRGGATIEDMSETGWTVNEQPQVLFELTVTVAGRDPYRARVTETVPLLALAHLVKGGSLPVLVDAHAPEHLLILWRDL
jgi:hypothetical protein